MKQIMLGLAVASAVIYLLLVIKGWVKQLKTPDTSRRSYFWGLAFAVFFYYGFLIWWARYGIKMALKLTLACFVAVGFLQFVLRYAGIIEIDGIGESIALGLFLSVPIRAVGGIYVAYRDVDWRNDNLLRKRKN